MNPRPLRDIVGDLRAYVAQHQLKQEFLAIQVRRSQGTVSRALNNEPKRLSRCLQDLCEYAKIPVTDDVLAAEERALPPNLVHAIQGLWNGAPEQAEALARVLRGVSELIRTARPTERK